MYNVLDDYLKTYNPHATEYHSDSSDFEGTNSSQFTQKRALRKPPIKMLYPNHKNNSMFQQWNSQTPVSEDNSKETWGSVTTSISPNGATIGIQLQKGYKNKKTKILDSGDQIEKIKSKRSVIRHKVMPCLSNMFRRPSNNVSQMSIIKENPAENVNIDNGCQATSVNHEHKIRKFNRERQYYAVQPVYAVEGNIHDKSPPFKHTKIVREPLTTCKAVGNGNYDVCSLTSSSEAVETNRYSKRNKGKRHKPKYNIVESGIGKEYFERYEGEGLKHIEQQYPSKIPVPLYNDYTTPDQCQQQQKHQSYKNAACAPLSSSLNASGIELTKACSGFWEYIVNKINIKQATPMKNETTTNTLPFKPCTCREASLENCCYPKSKRTYQNDSATAPTRRIEPACSCENMIKRKNKVDCQCFPTKDAKVRICPCEKTTPTRPCQLNHDKVTDLLSNKYNGEILCIHDPPCILINGCLNIPPERRPKKDQYTEMVFFGLTTDAKEKKSGKEEAQIKRPKQQPEACHLHKTSEYEEPQLQICQIDACCQCLMPTMKIKSRFNNTKNESCQYEIPHLLKNVMGSNHGICYHSSPLDRRRQQQTTDDESHSDEKHKHQATAIESRMYWLAPNEVRRQEITRESCQYRQSSSPTDTRKQPLTSGDRHEKLRPAIEVKQIETKQTKQEKIVQSICPHNPPCEVVRTCCKTSIDPKFQNSCVHVPMCENVPLCLMELKNQYQNISFRECPHKPRCAKVPVCTRNYIVLTAKEEAATQVRPKTKMVCRHEPPCIMIPTCLASVCDSCIPYDAIPDCIHQPMCEMIPACCRKSAKEMISFRSQYPEHSFFRRWKNH